MQKNYRDEKLFRTFFNGRYYYKGVLSDDWTSDSGRKRIKITNEIVLSTGVPITEKTSLTYANNEPVYTGDYYSVNPEVNKKLYVVAWVGDSFAGGVLDNKGEEDFSPLFWSSDREDEDPMLQHIEDVDFIQRFKKSLVNRGNVYVGVQDDIRQ